MSDTLELVKNVKATNIDITALTVKEKEQLLNDLTQSLYVNVNKKFIPMWPWVFVRILNKDQKVGRIYTITNQNKTIHEAIVLATWQPFVEEATKKDADGRIFTRVLHRKSALIPGDHVLLPHWAGLPIEGYSDKHYRVVKEEDWTSDKEGGIFGVVEYSEENTKPHTIFREMLTDMLSEALADDGITNEPDKVISIVTAKLEERFLLVDRNQGSLTLSGR